MIFEGLASEREAEFDMICDSQEILDDGFGEARFQQRVIVGARSLLGSTVRRGPMERHATHDPWSHTFDIDASFSARGLVLCSRPSSRGSSTTPRAITGDLRVLDARDAAPASPPVTPTATIDIHMAKSVVVPMSEIGAFLQPKVRCAPSISLALRLLCYVFSMKLLSTDKVCCAPKSFLALLLPSPATIVPTPSWRT